VTPDVEAALVAFYAALRQAQCLTGDDRHAFVAQAVPSLSKSFAPEIAVQAAEELLQQEAEWSTS
jgi:hypothetical protein